MSAKRGSSKKKKSPSPSESSQQENSSSQQNNSSNNNSSNNNTLSPRTEAKTKITKLTVKQLKGRLKKYKADETGLKAVLVNRLYLLEKKGKPAAAVATTTGALAAAAAASAVAVSKAPSPRRRATRKKASPKKASPKKTATRKPAGGGGGVSMTAPIVVKSKTKKKTKKKGPFPFLKKGAKEKSKAKYGSSVSAKHFKALAKKKFAKRKWKLQKSVVIARPSRMVRGTVVPAGAGGGGAPSALVRAVPAVPTAAMGAMTIAQKQRAVRGFIQTATSSVVPMVGTDSPLEPTHKERVTIPVVNGMPDSIIIRSTRFLPGTVNYDLTNTQAVNGDVAVGPGMSLPVISEVGRTLLLVGKSTHASRPFDVRTALHIHPSPEANGDIMATHFEHHPLGPSMGLKRTLHKIGESKRKATRKRSRSPSPKAKKKKKPGGGGGGGTTKRSRRGGRRQRRRTRRRRRRRTRR